MHYYYSSYIFYLYYKGIDNLWQFDVLECTLHAFNISFRRERINFFVFKIYQRRYSI